MTQVVVCGAGIAGVSTAFHLTRAGINDVVIVDPLPPLTLTSDKSTECYRNWWPNEPMVRLMNRSIDLLEQYAAESGDVFSMNRRGYLYLAGDAATLDQLTATAKLATTAGAGELRIHDGRPAHSAYSTAPDKDGADLFVERGQLRKHFPFVTDQAIGGLHARRAGWLSAQQLGTWMLEQALEAGTTLVSSAVEAVNVSGGRIESVSLDDGSTLPTPTFVNAAGPLLHQVGSLTGINLPVFSEIHAKTGFRDHFGAIPRDAPMIIWNDQQVIAWAEDESDFLRDEGRNDLLGLMPAGCHARPEGGPDSPWALGLWEYHSRPIDPIWPIPFDPMYTEVVLRGLAKMVPALAGYRDHLPEAHVDGGYYTKTVENRPLAGPAGPAGAYVCGALSGFGIMAACGVGELVATAIAGGAMPDWARWFDLCRYEDPAYVRAIETSGDTGQL
ncbi:MAG: FAD-binding oxidoreductase [Acidimicrobiia bacterium]|nr:FAD-binding oxidoreductase [Acidimicrobiia bacterium]MDX2465863.1 FAD-binding oxidoreductase [Acidimicrobiia bacterium]